MEVQMTDFENAAFSIFIVLLTRVILSFGLNFYIPITKVCKNIQANRIVHLWDVRLMKIWQQRTSAEQS